MADVFISYNSTDRPLVRLVATFLEGEGYSVWWDSELISGDDFQLRILDELTKSRAVIVIWTPTSVKSLWVRSEAGRAQADHKLIPLKAGSITYDDIPPPFNLIHAEDVTNRGQLLLAVNSQLSKPPPTPVVVKQFKHQLYSWIGVIGSVITLFSNLRGATELAKWIHFLVEGWAEVVTQFWRTVLILPDLDRGDAIATTFVVFGFISIVNARQANGYVAGRIRPLNVFIPCFIIVLAFAAGLFISTITSIASHIAIATASIALALFSITPQLFDARNFFIGDFIDYILLILVACLPWFLLIWLWSRNNQTQMRASWLAWPVLGSTGPVILGSFGVIIITESPMDWVLFNEFATTPLPIALALLPLGGLLAVVAAHILNVKLNLRSAIQRLWRIIVGLLLLGAANLVFVWIEKQPWMVKITG